MSNECLSNAQRNDGFGACPRQLEKAAVSCVVVAPSLIPKKSGNRVKTDKRDAIKLAHYHRSSDLTSVRVLDESTEALRDLFRARDDAKTVERLAASAQQVSTPP